MTDEMKRQLKRVRAFVASVSGVLHNNQDIIGRLDDGRLFTGWLRSHYDGQGVSLLRAIGIHVAFVSVDPYDPTDPICRMIERWNSLPSASRGWQTVKLINDVVGKEQIPPVEAWLVELGYNFDDCAIMGHDLVQIPLMWHADKNGSLLVAPSQAENIAKKIAHIVTPRPGGNGALRDFVNLVLEANDVDPTILPTR